MPTRVIPGRDVTRAVVVSGPAANQTSFTRKFHEFIVGGKTSLPKGAQWYVNFESLDSIFPAITKSTQDRNIAGILNQGDEWVAELNDKALASSRTGNHEFCMFCHAIGIPGESMVANPEGIAANNFVRSYVGQGRNAFPTLRMSFLETNLSFAESILRGWVVATSTYGLIARPKGEKNYRTNIVCCKLHNSKTIAKWTFFDACCISLAEEEYNYQATSSPMLREAQFVYNSYKFENINISDTNGDLPNVSTNAYFNLDAAVNAGNKK
jgi:hypothetical protein